MSPKCPILDSVESFFDFRDRAVFLIYCYKEYLERVY